MKPQHVRKKEGEEDAHMDSEPSVPIPTSAVEWNGYDSVDGDFDAEKLQYPSPGSDTVLKSQNGHTRVMDMKPMLEFYNSAETKESRQLLGDHLLGPPTPLVTESDVIIQGRRPIFSESEESNIAGKLKQWKEQGIKYTRLDVVKMASEYAIHLGKRPQGRPLTVKWFRSFLTRHPECYIRKTVKTKSEKPEKQYFNQLDSILTTYNLKESPHCIFSLVELPLSMLKNGEISTAEDLSIHRGSANGVKPSHKLKFAGNVPSSILICGSAAGQALPPFLLFAGKAMDKSILPGLTPGAGGMMCPSGRATSEVLVSFLRDHFLSQAPGRAGDTLVLLLDAGLGRALNQAVFDIGSAFKVVFVTAQMTLNPQLHPMVVGCCDIFQRELHYELQKPLYTSESSPLSSASICEFICRLYHRSMSAENLHTTFRKAGIFPFNPLICRKCYGLAAVSTGLGSSHPSKNSSPVLNDLSLQSQSVEDDDMECKPDDIKDSF